MTSSSSVHARANVSSPRHERRAESAKAFSVPWLTRRVRLPATSGCHHPGMRTNRIVPTVVLATTVMVVAVVVGVAVVQLSSESLKVLSAWPGPVHLGPGSATQPLGPDEDGLLGHADGRDAVPGWLDISRVVTSDLGQAHWSIELAGRPPRADGLAGAGRHLTFGLVFDIHGDGVADVVVGISNTAPVPGEFRVWVTDLATDTTEEQVGGPYGFPIEFRHPDEQDEGGPPTMVFTFLGSSAPPGLTAASRFYAWAALTDPNGDVVAWDYAPDAAWLMLPPER